MGYVLCTCTELFGRFSGLALNSMSCSPLWRISGDFNSPTVKSISQIHSTNIFLNRYTSHLLENFAIFNIAISRYPDIHSKFMVYN